MSTEAIDEVSGQEVNRTMSDAVKEQLHGLRHVVYAMEADLELTNLLRILMRRALGQLLPNVGDEVIVTLQDDEDMTDEHGEPLEAVRFFRAEDGIDVSHIVRSTHG